MKAQIKNLLIPLFLIFITGCIGDDKSSTTPEPETPVNNEEEHQNQPNDPPSLPEQTNEEQNTPSGTEKIIWANYPGIPDDADLLADGTGCEEFSHVKHLPWNERPSACPSGDWCMKKDDGFIPGASTWFGLRAVNQYATITCKIGNQCLR